MPQPRNLRTALVYAKLGWRVFPVHSVGLSNGTCSCRNAMCSHPGKHPVGRLAPNGHLDASITESVISEWWGEAPWASIGIACGAESGLLILDKDPRNGGNESLKALIEEKGPLAPTVVCKTGGGGEHFYFKHPGGFYPKAKPLPGIDIQGDGSYVIAPYSSHKNGVEYTWGSAPGVAPLADPPQWLLDACTQQRPEKLTIETPEVDNVYEAGNRNTRLFADACAMRRRGFEEEAILKALHEQNLVRCSPPLDNYEVEQIAHSAMRYKEEDHLGPGEVEAMPEVSTKRPLCLLSFKEILQAAPEDPPWIVPEWKAKGEATVLAGMWGAGKSLLALQLALQQARSDRSRANFLGLFPLPGPAQRILYIDEENARPLIKMRVQHMARALGISLDECENFTYASLNGINLDSKAGYSNLIKLIEHYRPDEVFFDSMLRFHHRKENDNTEMGAFFTSRVQPLILDDIAVTFIHHMGKPPREGNVDVGQQIRGASDIPGFFHEVWALASQDGERKLHQCKSRWGRSPSPIMIEIEESGELNDEYQLRVVGREERVAADKILWDMLMDEAEAGLRRQGMIQALGSKGFGHESADKAVSRLCKRWKNQGKVVAVREGMEMRYWLTRFAPTDRLRTE